ncbi:MAG: SRPBCC domain-containing protein [Pseudomonadota bacterium]
MDIQHETLVFERTFQAPPARLFRAYTDPKEREAWSAPTPETLFVIDESDVRTGGRETARCGTGGSLSWTMQVLYHYVTEDRQITFTEELWNERAMVTVALITFDLSERDGGGTRLKLTDQVTSFVGTGGLAGHREGYAKALDNLAARLVPA